MWQDYALAAGGATFIVALIPSLVTKQKPHRLTCLVTFLVLAMFAVAQASLKLMATAVVSGVTAMAWALLMLQRREAK